MKKEKAVMLWSAAVCVVALVCMTVVVLMKNASDQQVSFKAPEFDAAAEEGIPEVPEELGYSEIDAKAFKAWLCGKLVEENGSVDIYLTNSEGNAVWMKVKLYDSDENVMGESGLIKPGEYVKSVKIVSVGEGERQVKIKIMTYDPETYLSLGVANLQTSITS